MPEWNIFFGVTRVRGSQNLNLTLSRLGLFKSEINYNLIKHSSSCPLRTSSPFFPTIPGSAGATSVLQFALAAHVQSCLEVPGKLLTQRLARFLGHTWTWPSQRGQPIWIYYISLNKLLDAYYYVYIKKLCLHILNNKYYIYIY